MQVKVQMYNSVATLPKKAYLNDLGADVVAVERKIISPWQVRYKIGIGIGVPNYGFFLAPRSSVRDRYLSMANSFGVIDEPYTGEIEATFYVASILAWLPWLRKEKGKWKFSWNRLYQVGDRVAQVIPMPTYITHYAWGQLSTTQRGIGGHGSTN